VDKTFKAFFRRLGSGKKPGFPRYQAWGGYDSVTFPTYGDGCRLQGKLRIQGAGEIKVKLHRGVEGEIKTVTVKREAGRWFVCLSVEKLACRLPVSSAEVGIDVGLESFAALSDGSVIENPRPFQAVEAKLRGAQRRVARRRKGSNRRRKAVRLLERLHAHIRSQRSDFQHRLSFSLVALFGLIAVEDLNVKGMAQGRLAKQVADAGWSSFLCKLAYKAANAGRELVRVDPKGTSQTCVCGASVPKRLAERWHACPACGLSQPRDVVSAQVILQRARTGRSGVNEEVVVSCVA